MQRQLFFIFVLTHGVLCSAAQDVIRINAMTETGRFTAHGVNTEPVKYKGKRALRVTGVPNSRTEQFVRINGVNFKNGVIEAYVSGSVEADAFEGARGFVGLAFRVDEDNRTMECMYLRPTNGRCDDQIRRNHSVQYVSSPDYTWQRFRRESPEKYESYADLVPGAWTRIRIEVAGQCAKLFVNDAKQPVLIVNDLKRGSDVTGGIGLWIGLGTVAHFSEIKITPAP